MTASFDHDVAIVGAGPAGIGTAVALGHLDVDCTILERDCIGASFRQWPDEMRLLTPSFPATAFGERDLNAITPDTSPALALDCEHPTGNQYANYLEAVAEFHELEIETGVDVDSVESTNGGFTLETADSPHHARYVIWAAGQFQYPSDGSIPGASHAVHSSAIDSWDRHVDLVRDDSSGHSIDESTPVPADSEADRQQTAADGAGTVVRSADVSAPEADDAVVVGGAESGIDAAIELADRGCSVTVVDEDGTWQFRSPDPSEVLAPRTNERLAAALENDAPIDLLAGARVDRIDPARDPDDGDASEGYDVVMTTGDRLTSRTPPILATGFEGSLTLVDELFAFDDGVPALTDRDESTETPGLFLVGPQVAHNGQQFCFIYKYRQRFAVVAETIGDRLGVDTEPLDAYREKRMYLDDLDCCEPDYCDC